MYYVRITALHNLEIRVRSQQGIEAVGYTVATEW